MMRSGVGTDLPDDAQRGEMATEVDSICDEYGLWVFGSRIQGA